MRGNGNGITMILSRRSEVNNDKGAGIVNPELVIYLCLYIDEAFNDGEEVVRAPLV
jgi:hypothetical protein